jgi:hypothetical protein
MNGKCECKVRGLWKFPESDLVPLMVLDSKKSESDWIEMIEKGIFENGLKAYNGAICAQISGLMPIRWACFYSERSEESGRLIILDDFHKFDYRSIPC